MSMVDVSGSGAAHRFAQLALDLHGSGGMDETVDAVVQFALQALDCSHAGVALIVRNGKLQIPATTDPVVAEIYAFQVAGGKGPLTESMRDHALVRIRDTDTEGRWPEWAEKVRSLG